MVSSIGPRPVLGEIILKDFKSNHFQNELKSLKTLYILNELKSLETFLFSNPNNR